jgi:phosphoribosylglycinamide formyltransferase-1
VDYETILQNFKTDPEKIPPPRDFDLTDLLSKQSIFSANAAPEKINTFFTPRAIAEARLLAEMMAFPFDVLVLAGFMRVLTPYFIDRINTHPGHFRIMNIHPALLPSFPGTDGYGDTYRYGCKIGGGTVHFVDYGEDSGPIIGQKAFEIDGDDTVETIKKKGLKLEWELYPQSIQLFAEGRLKIVNRSYRLKNGEKATKTVVKVMPPQPDM